MVQSLSLNRGTALPFYKTIEFATGRVCHTLLLGTHFVRHLGMSQGKLNWRDISINSPQRVELVYHQ